MKLLIVFGWLPLFSASPFYSRGNGAGFSKDSLIPKIHAIAKDPAAAVAIDKIFNNDNVCLRNMDEVIEAIEESSELVAAAEGDLQSLNHHVDRLEGLRGESEVVREVAAILRDLNPLIEKLNPVVSLSKACSGSTKNTFAYLQSLAIVMHELSYDKKVAPTKQTRDTFHQAGSIVSALVNFLNQVKIQSREFKNFCHPNQESTERGIRALGNMIGGMADMFSTVGNFKAGEEVRKGKFITDNIANQVTLINDLNVGFQDCSITDLRSAADTMDDLASLIDEIGIEKLSHDLGVDMSMF